DGLDPDKLSTLRELLKTCSAQVVGETGARGSGFFVDERLLLTCAHVAGENEGAQVEVRPFGGTPRPGTIRALRPGNALDLALVDVQAVAGEDSPPAVVLDETLVDDVDYYAV